MDSASTETSEMPPLDPISKLFADTWSLYKKKFFVLLGILAIPEVFSILTQIFIRQKSLPFSIIVIGTSLLGGILGVVAHVGIILAFSEDIEIKEAYQRGINFFWPLFWVSILYFIVSLGGFFMFIVPGIMMGIWFYFYVYTVVIEKRKGLGALVQSREYSRGYWWEIFGRTLLLGFFIVLPIGIICLPLYFIFGLIPAGIAYFILAFFISPFALAYSYSIYRNITVLKPHISATQITKGRKFLITSAIVGLVGIFAIIALIGIGIHYGPLKKTQTLGQEGQITNPTELSDFIMGSIDQRGPQYLGLFYASSSTTYWGTQDGYLVPLSGWYQLYSPYFPTTTDATTTRAIANLTQYTEQLLLNNGFKPDLYNTSTSTDNGPFYRLRTGFVSSDGALHCVMQLPQRWQYLSQWYFQCALDSDIEATLQYDRPYLKILGNPKGAAVFPAPSGNFARVEVGNEIELFYTAILIKTGDSWNAIYTVPGSPPCSLMEQYAVPQSIFVSCRSQYN